MALPAGTDLILEHIAYAHNPETEAQRTTWSFQGQTVGSISTQWCELAQQHLGAKLDAQDLQAVLNLCADIKTRAPLWMDEPFGLFLPDQEQPVGQVPRGSVSYLGLQARGVHANGFVRRTDGIHMWVAKRALDKPTFPGQWDNMVGGGLTAGFTHAQILAKETDEEAGLDVNDLTDTRFVGTLNYQHAHEGGLRNDRLFIYDLELPDGIEPHPKDGEVERFELWPLARVREVIQTTRDFKYNCNLVIIEFLLRHGALDDHQELTAIKSALDQRFQPA